jgi:outer membrane protein OmpA-like peptidoglycan-associated protein
MKIAQSKVIWTLGLVGVSAAAWADAAVVADTAQKKPSPHEPAGFVAGAVIGGFAAGPVGAVVGAGLGTWLGSRVHRAHDAAKAEAQVAVLQNDRAQLEKETAELKSESAALASAKGDLEETNRALTARLDQLAHTVDTAQEATDDAAREQAAKVIDGLQGDVLFRTGSAQIDEETARDIEVIAGVLTKSPALTVRLDGYADPRGSDELNLKLSQARADAVRDLLLAAGVPGQALEVNAYGKSQSTAVDVDGYAFERRVRLTLQAAPPAPLAQVSEKELGETQAGEPAGPQSEKR